VDKIAGRGHGLIGPGTLFHPRMKNADLFAMLAQATEVGGRFSGKDRVNSHVV
jgi:hypothetical protein